MTQMTDMLSRRWADAVVTLLGLWLVASPWVLGHVAQTAPTWNAWIVGLIITVAAVAALTAFHAWKEWVNAALGLWLVVSPWVPGFAAALPMAMWNQVAIGVIVGALTLWTAWAGHGGKMKSA
jgi:hypothetical protein